jgi:mRNA (guanine-N7-)-methyltransferase
MSDPNNDNNSSNSTAVSNSIVAEHYDKKSSDSVDLATRSQSRIYYLRNFNNWIKSVLINEYIKKICFENRVQSPSVLDLGCGKGGDILKWIKSNVSHVTFVDISETSIEKCRERYNDPKRRPNFTANFIHIDATRSSIAAAQIEDDQEQSAKLHDLVSSQFVIHYSFESFAQADQFMKNVSESLKPGGYFIGTTTNANELIKRLRNSNSNSFGNDIYNIKFTSLNGKENSPIDLFGVKFDFQLDSVVECPEFLLNFDCLIELAKRHNLKFVFKKKFSDYFYENCSKNDYKHLITVMDAMEPYYPRKFASNNRTQSDDTSEYEYIESSIKNESSIINSIEEKLQYNEAYATISKSEWEAINLYLVFAFVKIDPNVEQEESLEEAESIDKREVNVSKENKRKLSSEQDEETYYEPVLKKKL